MTADVVILGGGIAGTGLAAELAGTCEVALIEPEARAGEHATGRSAAVLVPAYGDAVTRALTAAGRDAFEAPAADDPDAPPLLRPRGLLRLIAGSGRADHDARFGGVDGIAEISLDEAARRFPLLDPSGFVAASYEAGMCDIDVDALLQRCLRRARHAGARLLFGAAPGRIAREGGAWRVETPQGAVAAPVLVNAAGAWADAVAETAGVTPVGLTARRRSLAVVEVPAERAEGLAAWPMVVPFPFGWYAKPEAGRLLVSPGDADPVAPHDAYSDDMAVAEGLHRFEQAVNFAVTRVTASWAGLRTFSSDGQPVVGFDPAADGFFWLAGQGGFGIQTAPGLSRLAAALLRGAPPDPACDGDLVAALSPARFRAGAPADTQERASP